MYGKILKDLRNRFSGTYLFRRDSSQILILADGVEMIGVGNEIAIRHMKTTLIVGDNPAIRYLKSKLWTELEKGAFDDRVPGILGILALFEALVRKWRSSDNLEKYITNILDITETLQKKDKTWEETMWDKDLHSAISESDWSAFDPAAWERRW